MNNTKKKENYKVIVVGGGPAGFAATLAAAREGVEVLLIEKNSCVGGMATAGLLGFIGPLDNAERNSADWTRFRMDRKGEKYPENLNKGERIIGGIPAELISILQKEGSAFVPQFGYIEVDVESIKYYMEQLLLSAGARIQYNSQVVSAEYEENKINMKVAQKEGLRDIAGKIVIDCTGDGDIAFYLGGDYKNGRDSDGVCQAVTLVFRIGNVKTDYLDFLPDSQLYQKVIKTARAAFESGKINFNPNGLGCISRDPSNKGNFIVNHQHTYNIDGTNTEDITKALIKGRKQIHELIDFYRNYVPGCEKCYLIDTAFQLGIRETRRIIGDYILTGEDILKARKFNDAICRYSYYMDIHIPNSPESFKAPPVGDWYEIPYRALLPKKLENLLIAERCISGTHEAMSSYRLMPCCMATGEAAGTAAAISLKKNSTPRNINVMELRRILRKNGAII
ncbi:MAG TPA: FAD-dependent oxidoreductase [Victivallales bacterium]|nr:FAD-dependent oxidoreductase [Victivallales bacterium]